jgi:mediator of replication checkpoint protein 1
MLRLRYLAQLHSPEQKGRKGQKTMSMAELRLTLAQKARQQAQKEREEKIEQLRRRGIHIETEEERERRQLEIEDMVAQLEKSREKDRKLAKLEKDEARKAGEKIDDLPSTDESEDEDYAASGDDAAIDEGKSGVEAELELSGSEEEMDEGEDADDEEMDEAQDDPSRLLDNVAEESEREDTSESVAHVMNKDDKDDEDELQAPRPRHAAKRVRKVIIDEDEESDRETQRNPEQGPQNPTTPTRTAAFPSPSEDNDVLAAFGGFDSAAKSLGLTQMFAGTMADYASASQNAHALDMEPEQDSLDYLRSLPDTQPPDLPKGPSDTLVPNSQTPMSPQKDVQFSLGISQLLQSTPAFSPTQISEGFEPTQDAGFELPRAPAGLVPPTSTVETVMMSIAESPVMKKKSRLRRRKDAPPTELSDVDEDVQAGDSASEGVDEIISGGDAFTVMAKAAKKQKQVDNFNKKTSWARDAIEEQAQESEDEYAGIGGASDEDSGEDDEELAEMIDTNEVEVDERKIAAYYA